MFLEDSSLDFWCFGGFFEAFQSFQSGFEEFNGSAHAQGYYTSLLVAAW